MSMLARFATTGGATTTYVDDVFSTYLYTGNGSTQTINNGIDLAGQGGLVWIKCRSLNYRNHLFDTARGANIRLRSDGTEAQGSGTTWLTSFNSNGFSLGSNSDVNLSPETYTSWTFRKAPKFFDVVTYTGNGSTQAINHSLGQAPGMVILKNTTTTSTDWYIWHRSLTSGYYIRFDTNPESNVSAANFFGNNTTTVAPTSTQFTVGNHLRVNENGSTIVAYLFAHDTAADGLIQCGSFTGAGTSVTLGWEPQWLLMKQTSTSGDWFIADNLRGMPVASSSTQTLFANTSTAEGAFNIVQPTSTGFVNGGNSGTFIYLAIRRPNKPPTSGTQVYYVATGGGTYPETLTANFAPDFAISSRRTSAVSALGSRLTNRAMLGYSSTNESGAGSITWEWRSDSLYIGSSFGGTGSAVSSVFRRAPGFFDQVCHTGTGANLTLAHNLTVIPELVITKKRSATNEWYVTHSFTGTGYKRQFLEQTAAATDHLYSANFIYTAQPTTSSLFFTGNANVNQSTDTFIHYLFASLPGISKVGSYTGNGGAQNTNGTSQTINCGFSAGARFVLIKRTDSTGGWFVFDTARGIVAANDPYLLLNSTAAEVTTVDAVDADNSGFIVNQTSSTDLNVTNATYIYLAIA